MKRCRAVARGRIGRWMGVVIVAALVAASCTPVPDPVEPDEVDPALFELLEDPDFVAQFGETEEERDQIVADIRAFLESGEASGIDAETFAQAAAEKAEYDQSVADAAAEEAAAEEAASRAEADRLSALAEGPTLEDNAAALTDGSEDYDTSMDSDHWAGIEGAGNALGVIAETAAYERGRVQAEWDRLEASGELAEKLKIPGWVPPEGEGNYVYAMLWADQVHAHEPASGTCTGRDGNRNAPIKNSLRPGTIFSPRQNTFASTDGTDTYLGDLEIAYVGGKKHVVVEGHLGDLDALNQLPGTGHIWQQLRVRLTVHHPDEVASSHQGVGPYTTPWIPGMTLETGMVQILCYYNDFAPEPGEEIRRAMYRAFVPWEDLQQNSLIDEPGFQVRATVTEAQYLQQNGWQPVNFWGSDMRTVFLGQEPLGHNEVFDNGGFGVSVGRGVIIDDNSVANDDLESALRGPVSNAVVSTLSGLDGASEWVWGTNGGNYGYLGFHINNSNPTTPNVDIDWAPTTAGGSTDDEHRVKASLSMTDWLVEGYVSILGAPCYVRMKVDWSATAYAAIDIHDTARTQLLPEIEVASLGLNVHNMFASPYPIRCNLLYLASWTSKWQEKLDDKLPDINETLSNNLAVEPDIGAAVPATIPLGGSANIKADFFGFNDTCVPYQCNGHKAGDMAMSWAGLEASGDIRFTDTESPWTNRRFPASYSPTTSDTANGRIRQHFGAQNEITDFGAWVNPAVLNQALRAIAEEGVLDLDFDATTSGKAMSPPIYLNEPVSADKPVGLFIPHLRIDPHNDPNLFAVDLFAAIGVGFDSGTRKLVPAPVDPNDPGVGVQLWTMRCNGVVWLTCEQIPNLASDVLNWAANTIMDPLLQNSIGQVTVPQADNFPIGGFLVTNEDGHLGVRASVGAAQLRAWGSINASTYDFNTFWEGLTGTGPVTYTWTIKDAVTQATILTYTGPNHQFTGLNTSTLTTLALPGPDIKAAVAEITAQRAGGTSKYATHTVVLQV